LKGRERILSDHERRCAASKQTGGRTEITEGRRREVEEARAAERQKIERMDGWVWCRRLVRDVNDGRCE